MKNDKDLNRIKVVLVEKHLTSKWLAEQLGKSACTISKWCSQKSQPDLQTIDQIANLLNVKRSDLIVD
jgi:transcriptional regulator with XRE-family HTH domain